MTNTTPETTGPYPSLRIALVEDDPHLLAHFMALLAASPDMQVVGTARTLAQGVDMLKNTTPPAQVLMVDLGLPDGSGVELIKVARLLWPQCEVMVCSSFSDEAQVLEAIEAGAGGYLLKDSPAPQILDEIRLIAQGGSPISPRIARHVLRRMHNAAPQAMPPDLEDDTPALTARELQVLQHLAHGGTYDEMAAQLGISRFTVQAHVRNIYAKLSATSKLEALRVARKHGLVV